jgi:hypothetical protein
VASFALGITSAVLSGFAAGWDSFEFFGVPGLEPGPAAALLEASEYVVFHSEYSPLSPDARAAYAFAHMFFNDGYHAEKGKSPQELKDEAIRQKLGAGVGQIPLIGGYLEALIGEDSEKLAKHAGKETMKKGGKVLVQEEAKGFLKSFLGPLKFVDGIGKLLSADAGADLANWGILIQLGYTADSVAGMTSGQRDVLARNRATPAPKYRAGGR